MLLRNDDPTSLLQVVVLSPEFLDLIAQDPGVEVLASDAVWSEGPACLPDGRVIWSDVKANRVMIWDGGPAKEFVNPSDFQNGHAVDMRGRLVAASHGVRGIVRQSESGEWQTLVDSFEGKRLNSPNDLVVAFDGAIWFSDPTFGLLSSDESYGGTSEMEGEFVYRFDPEKQVLTRMTTPELRSPNGLAFSPDEKLLYIADSELAHDFSDEMLAHRILVYQVHQNALAGGRVFAKVEPGIPDGIKVDAGGNVWSTCKEGIQVFDSTGKMIGKLLIRSSNTGNLNFCSRGDKHRLLITAEHLVLRIEVKIAGAVGR